MNEQYLTVAEVAEMLDVSQDTVRRMFRNEAGVIDVRSHKRHTSRPYRILRIPRSVLTRVIAGREVDRSGRVEPPRGAVECPNPLALKGASINKDRNKTGSKETL